MKSTNYTYILSNEDTTIIYTGVTTNLLRTCFEHRNNLVEGMAAQYHIDKLIYFEAMDTMEQAVQRAKQIKGLTREKKAALIHAFNPAWMDLYIEPKIDMPMGNSLFHPAMGMVA